MVERCEWAREGPMRSYHDCEWGVPVHDDRVLFEFLSLEGAQAGLSWETILRKREAYRRAFDNFEIARVAAYDEARQASLLTDRGIIRNRLKIAAIVNNARLAAAVRDEFGSLDAYLWRHVDGRPVRNAWRAASEIPAQTEASRAMSRGLKRRGFKFAGPTICYAFMQAVGMVNDHVVGCFRHDQV